MASVTPGGRLLGSRIGALPFLVPSSAPESVVSLPRAAADAAGLVVGEEPERLAEGGVALGQRADGGADLLVEDVGGRRVAGLGRGATLAAHPEDRAGGVAHPLLLAGGFGDGGASAATRALHVVNHLRTKADISTVLWHVREEVLQRRQQVRGGRDEVFICLFHLCDLVPWHMLHMLRNLADLIHSDTETLVQCQHVPRSARCALRVQG